MDISDKIIKSAGKFGKPWREFVRGVCSRVAEDVDPYNVEKLGESRVNSCAVLFIKFGKLTPK